MNVTESLMENSGETGGSDGAIAQYNQLARIHRRLYVQTPVHVCESRFPVAVPPLACPLHIDKIVGGRTVTCVATCRVEQVTVVLRMSYPLFSPTHQLGSKLH